MTKFSTGNQQASLAWKNKNLFLRNRKVLTSEIFLQVLYYAILISLSFTGSVSVNDAIDLRLSTIIYDGRQPIESNQKLPLYAQEFAYSCYNQVGGDATTGLRV